MIIALTGEGPTDYGQKEWGTNNWLEGPVQKYVRKIANKNGVLDLKFVVLEREDVQKVKLQRTISKGLENKAVPARKFVTLMLLKDIEKGIYYCDADRQGGSKNTEFNAKKRYDELYDSVTKGLKTTNAIPMIALRMIECWLLADNLSLEKIFQVEIPVENLPKKPEYIWGNVNQDKSDYPKNYLERVIKNSNKKMKKYISNREDFAMIAENTRLDVILQRCPLSFGKFSSDLEDLLKR